MINVTEEDRKLLQVQLSNLLNQAAEYDWKDGTSYTTRRKWVKKGVLSDHQTFE